MISIISTIKEEEKYFKEKFPSKEDIINLQVRENLKGMSKIVVAFKYYYGLNHYSTHNNVINKGNKTDEYLRYSKMKTWEHIVKCNRTTYKRIGLIVNLYKELK